MWITLACSLQYALIFANEEAFFDKLLHDMNESRMERFPRFQRPRCLRSRMKVKLFLLEFIIPCGFGWKTGLVMSHPGNGILRNYLRMFHNRFVVV